MRKIAVGVLLLIMCAAPAFAIWPFSKKQHVHKDPRVAEHPKAYHQKNEHLKEVPKNKLPKHNA